ncbi:MAG TPA: hydantoinase B/oxoprolinase family protein, partial [bacterium]|nr:hydantoinase B/oxoprolinase family protein [bacterium]
TAIFDKQGRPIAMFSDISNQQIGYFQIQKALEEIPEFYPGDIFIMNDPYLGMGTHLDDWSFYRPIFYKDRLEFFTMIRGHQMDTGGSHPGGYHAEPFDLHSEGLRLRPIKICEKGVMRRDVYTLITDNMRWSEGVRMDHQSFFAALKFCESQVVDMIEKYGLEQIYACCEAMIELTRRAIRKEIEGIPDGVYTGEATCDDDGTAYDVPVTVRVKVTVKGAAINADFSESDPQVKGFINSPLTHTYCKAHLALLTCIVPGMADYHNQGSLEDLQIITKKGTVVDPIYPAPVGCCPVIAGGLILEAMWEALSKAVPENVPAQPTRSMHPHIVSDHPRTGKSYEIKNFWAEGGGGAVYGYDGWPNTSPHGSGVLCKSSIEVMEASFPWRALRYKIATDHAGAGKWRGGVGNFWSLLNEGKPGLLMTGPADGQKLYSLKEGYLGGKAGKVNEIYIVRHGERIPVAGKRNVPLQEGDELLHISGGGAGVGNPLERDVECIREDVLEGVISLEGARRDYGVVIDPDNLKVDLSETAGLRAQMKIK